MAKNLPNSFFLEGTPEDTEFSIQILRPFANSQAQLCANSMNQVQSEQERNDQSLSNSESRYLLILVWKIFNPKIFGF